MKLKVIFLIQVIIGSCIAAEIDRTGKYIHDTRGNYIPDKLKSGKYIADVRGFYVSDSRGRYVPDNRGLYKFIKLPIVIPDKPIPVISAIIPPQLSIEPPRNDEPSLIQPDIIDGSSVDYNTDA
ncbi:unnamed protein product [Diamesa serratosioi]